MKNISPVFSTIIRPPARIRGRRPLCLSQERVAQRRSVFGDRPAGPGCGTRITPPACRSSRRVRWKAPRLERGGTGIHRWMKARGRAAAPAGAARPVGIGLRFASLRRWSPSRLLHTPAAGGTSSGGRNGATSEPRPHRPGRSVPGVSPPG